MNINMNGAVTTTGELNKMCHRAEKKKKKRSRRDARSCTFDFGAAIVLHK